MKEEEDSISWYDLNSDGIVDISDLNILIDLFSNPKSPESYIIGDINPDGVIDKNDIEKILDNNNRQADWYINNN